MLHNLYQIVDYIESGAYFVIPYTYKDMGYIYLNDIEVKFLWINDNNHDNIKFLWINKRDFEIVLFQDYKSIKKIIQIINNNVINKDIPEFNISIYETNKEKAIKYIQRNLKINRMIE